MDYAYDDGGRQAAGYRGTTGDCVTRAVAIAAGLPYQEVYDRLTELGKDERPRAGRRRSHARTGVHRRTLDRYLTDLGYRWVATMAVGSGCRVHLRADELPAGVLVVRLSRHIVAVVDGVVRDTADPRRDGTRCVYGYWTPAE